jgi:hypothetical protein
MRRRFMPPSLAALVFWLKQKIPTFVILAEVRAEPERGGDPT